LPKILEKILKSIWIIHHNAINLNFTLDESMTLLGLNGYDPKLLSSMETGQRRSLWWSSLWSTLGLMCSALALVSVAGLSGMDWFGSLLLGFLVAIALIVLQAHGSTSVFLSSLRLGPDHQQQHRSHLFFSSLLLLLVLICSQGFIALGAVVMGYGMEVNRSSLESQWRLQIAKNSIDSLNLERAEISEVLRSIDNTQALPSNSSQHQNDDDILTRISNSTRRALIIGNNSYHIADPLKGAVRDAQRLGELLERMGFNVMIVQDASRKVMEAALHKYVRLLKPGDISFFFFSGHGFQQDGLNYLLGVEGNSTRESLSVNTAAESINFKRPLLSIISIDACRSSTEQAVEGIKVPGMASIELGESETQTFISLATSPGRVALELMEKDGAWGGLYASSMIEHLYKPLPIPEIFTLIRNDVESRSRKVIGPDQFPQITWDSHNLRQFNILLTDTGTMVSPVTSSMVARPSGSLLSTPRSIDFCTIIKAQNDGSTESSIDANCLLARLYRIDDDIKDKEQELIKANILRLNEADDVSRNIYSTSVAYRSFWSNPYRATGWTIILFIIMAGGILWRSMLKRTHAMYIDMLNEACKNDSERLAQEAIRIINGLPLVNSHSHPIQRIHNLTLQPTVDNRTPSDTLGLFDFLLKN
jgi:hypothetical protein